MMTERELHFNSIGAVAGWITHDLECAATGENPIRRHPGRGEDLLSDGRSRLFVKAVDGSRVEREEMVWQRALAEFRKGSPLCESPIERDLLAGLLTADWGYFHTENAVIHDCRNEEFPDEPVVIAPQLVVARYRLDFALVLRRGKITRTVAIECDGKDYHDRERDNRRDEYLSALGIGTIRHGGQDIHRIPLGCANEIAEGVAFWWEQFPQ